MKTISTISAGLLLFVWVLNCSVSGTPAETNSDGNSTKAESETRQTSQQAEKSGKKMDFVKTVDFQLNNGTFVSGRLISEDKNKIVVEEVQDSGMTVSTSQQLDKSMQQIDKTVATVQDNYQKLEANVSKTNEDITQRLKDLESRVRENERVIDQGWLVPRYYYSSPQNRNP
jgi:hypothetical protein